MFFALVVPRRPPSGSKGPNRKFQDAIRAEARAKVGEQPPLAGNLYVRIAWFHSKATTQDVDNIAKNILDALKGVVFGDDVQIVQCLACKIDTKRDYELADTEVPSDAVDELLLTLAAGHDHVLYIEIGAVNTQRISFGPIGGGTI